MDLLFKRYASPFLLLDNIIESGRLDEFVDSLIETTDEEKMWEVYLNTLYVNRKSFNEFIEPIKRTQAPEMTREDLEATVKSTKDILNDFKPSQNGGENIHE